MIQLNALTKKFGDKLALNNVSLCFDAPGIYGIIGHAGAGKSTLLQIISANTAATSGEVLIDGRSICEDTFGVKQSVGYLSEQNPMWKDMTVFEFLLFIAQAKKVPNDKAYKQIEELLELFEMGEIKNRLIKNLRQSERKLLGISRTLLGNPKAILLDEPLKSLTPNQKKIVKNAIKMIGEFKTVLICSSKPSEISDICKSFVLLTGGQVVATDTPQKLEARVAEAVSLEFTANRLKDDILALLGGIEGFDVSECVSLPCNISSSSRFKVDYNSKSKTKELIINALTQAKISVSDVKTYSLTLDDICFAETDKDEDKQPVKKDKQKRRKVGKEEK